MDMQMISKISKQSRNILLVLILLESVIFLAVFNFQPSKGDVTIDMVSSYKTSDAFGYDGSELSATFYGISTNDMLGVSRSASENKSITDFIMSRYDNKTGLFFDKNKQLSLPETYFAISTLYKLEKLNILLNTTLVSNSIMDLKTTNSLFRNYKDQDDLHKYYGDVRSFFQAISVLYKLSNGTDFFYQSLNRTNIAQSLAALQGDDGSVNSGYFMNQFDMNNAYHISTTINKLNVSLEFFKLYGFSSSNLINWIDSQYTKDGFSMTKGSKPTIEATAYAIISLKRLGINNTEIMNKYQEGIEEMVHEMIEEVQDEVDPLDVIHDIILALSISGNLDLLQQRVISEPLEDTMGAIIAITLILFFMTFAINSLNLMRQDDTLYFDSKISKVIETSIADTKKGIDDFSELLNMKIDKIVLIEHQDPTRGSIRLLSGNFEFIVTFTYDTWDPLKVVMLKTGSQKELLGIEFYESFLITQIQEKIAEIVKSSEQDE